MQLSKLKIEAHGKYDSIGGYKLRINTCYWLQLCTTTMPLKHQLHVLTQREGTATLKKMISIEK